VVDAPAMAIATRAGAGRMTSALTALETVFSGDLIEPAHPGYEATRRVWNGSIDRHPALIAQCRTTDDVAAALHWARGVGLPVAVRSGGHSFPGLSVCDDGIVIDLRRLNHVAVDPSTRTVRVGAGALLGELDAATQRFRMAVPLGAVSHTGVGGLALGGGIGWLMRHHGLTVDRMRSTSVLATDDWLTASADEQSDLFWAIRGGGGNFGIVTDFTFELRPVGPLVFGGFVYWALEDGHRLARLYRDWSADAPDALTTALVIRRAPAIEMIPSALHGRLVIGVGLCWSGELAAGERFAAPLRRAGSALLDLCAPRPFIEMQSLLDPGYPHGLWAYLRTCNLASLDDSALDVLLDQGERIVSPRSSITVWQAGGAVSRVRPEETAYGGRPSGHIVNVSGATDGPDGFDGERAWARAVDGALAPYGEGAYVNFLMDQGEDAIRAAYGTDRFGRLQAIKQRYDPDNVFRLNQNIPPAAPGGR
jgi:FAD/FMN-containing dehydrogenase